MAGSMARQGVSSHLRQQVFVLCALPREPLANGGSYSFIASAAVALQDLPLKIALREISPRPYWPHGK
jgi:hypothetical protein